MGPDTTDVLIVGGGLAGLRLAHLLTQAGHDFKLIEARSRLGGRILSADAADARFDLGPAWFWDGQPRIQTLVQHMELGVFEQYSIGDARFEDRGGTVHQGRGAGSMQGSLRLNGGLSALIDKLASALPPERIHLNTPMTGLTREGEMIIAKAADQRVIRARQVVLALPPRLAAGLSYTPALPENALQAMSRTPTWMAGQAKALLIYDRPFWRDEGLSGDAMSQVGPMVEIHDASPQDATSGALFGFIGVPPEHRRDKTTLHNALRQQVTRLFGSQAASPRDVIVQDWATEAFTATPEDAAPLMAHPHYGLPPALHRLWDGRLHFGNTEVAPQFGGFIEGALEAAETVFNAIKTKDPHRIAR